MVVRMMQNLICRCSAFSKLTTDKWTWGYKYNHAGVREQKRMQPADY